MKQMKQRIIVSLFLILGVSHFGYGQNTFKQSLRWICNPALTREIQQPKN